MPQKLHLADGLFWFVTAAIVFGILILMVQVITVQTDMINTTEKCCAYQNCDAMPPCDDYADQMCLNWQTIDGLT